MHSSQSHTAKGQEAKITSYRKNLVCPAEEVFHNYISEQADQRLHGISKLGDFQKSAGQDPEQPDLNLKTALF